MFIRCSLSAFWFGAKGRTGREAKRQLQLDYIRGLHSLLA